MNEEILIEEKAPVVLAGLELDSDEDFEHSMEEMLSPLITLRGKKR